jgi:hypothetical protein
VGLIIFEWSLRLAENGGPPTAEDTGIWLQRQFAEIGWPPPRIYHGCADPRLLQVECRFGDLDSFEAVWPRFESAALGPGLVRELGLRIVEGSECRQLYSTQYVRSAVDEK